MSYKREKMVDSQKENWPPPPGFGYEPPIKPHRFRWMLGWIGPLLSGVAGAIGGAILLPVLALLLVYLTNDAGSPIGFLIVMVFAAAIGAGAGFVCGFAGWFIGKAALRWWMRRHS